MTKGTVKNLPFYILLTPVAFFMSKEEINPMSICFCFVIKIKHCKCLKNFKGQKFRTLYPYV